VVVIENLVGRFGVSVGDPVGKNSGDVFSTPSTAPLVNRAKSKQHKKGEVVH
jgi:hypothetical protein